MELAGKVAIVTGASKGIGRAIALALARAGADVAIAARSRAELKQVADEITTLGRRVYAHAADLSKESQVQSFIRRTMKNLGRLDILVNNAGIGRFRPISDLSTAEWDEMFNLNMRGLFIATRESLPHLRQAGESVIVNVASLAGKNAFIGGGGYAATKHALIGFSRCLMLEERQNGVRVLVICPGSVETGFGAGHQEAANAKRKQKLYPEDVADSIMAMICLPQRAMLSEIDLRPSNP